MGSDGGDLSCSGSGMVADGNLVQRSRKKIFRDVIMSLCLFV